MQAEYCLKKLRKTKKKKKLDFLDFFFIKICMNVTRYLKCTLIEDINAHKSSYSDIFRGSLMPFYLHDSRVSCLQLLSAEESVNDRQCLTDSVVKTLVCYAKEAFHILIHVWISRLTGQRAQLSLPFCSAAGTMPSHPIPSHWEVLELCLASLWKFAKKSMRSLPGPDLVTLRGGSRWIKRRDWPKRQHRGCERAVTEAGQAATFFCHRL